MCKVNDIEECAKKVYIFLNNGEIYASAWFKDEERKNSYGQDVFTSLEKEKYNELIEENNLDEEDILHWSVNRDKVQEKNCIFISRHGFDRIRERTGWNKKTALRMVARVYDEGLSPDEVRGDYRPWVKQRAAKSPESELRLYGQYLYVFENNILITVIPAVKMYRPAVAC